MLISRPPGAPAPCCRSWQAHTIPASRPCGTQADRDSSAHRVRCAGGWFPIVPAAPWPVSHGFPCRHAGQSWVVLGTVGRSHGWDPESRLSSWSTLVPSLDEANLLHKHASDGCPRTSHRASTNTGKKQIMMARGGLYARPPPRRSSAVCWDFPLGSSYTVCLTPGPRLSSANPGPPPPA